MVGYSSALKAVVPADSSVASTNAACKQFRNWLLLKGALLAWLVSACGGAVYRNYFLLSNVSSWVYFSSEPWMAPENVLSDFTFLRNRVIDEHKWEHNRADGAIREYLRFMQMLAEAPAMELVASSDIDLVWHEHLVDTRNYAADCIKLFGRFLHHRRARTTDEFAEIPTNYMRTKHRYALRFGVPPPERFWGKETKASSMCGGGPFPTPSPPPPPSPQFTTNSTTGASVQNASQLGITTTVSLQSGSTQNIVNVAAGDQVSVAVEGTVATWKSAVIALTIIMIVHDAIIA